MLHYYSRWQSILVITFKYVQDLHDKRTLISTGHRYLNLFDLKATHVDSNVAVE